jgi:hypothetical protein
MMMVRSGCEKVELVVVPFVVVNAILMTGSCVRGGDGSFWASEGLARGATWCSWALVDTMKRNETVVSSVLWVYVVLMKLVVVVDNGELHKLWGLL